MANKCGSRPDLRYLSSRESSLPASSPAVTASPDVEKRSGAMRRREPTSAVRRRNERERNRVKQVNLNFDRLRRHIPAVARTKHLSKMDTLRSAVSYIQYLRDLLDSTVIDPRTRPDLKLIAQSGLSLIQSTGNDASSNGFDPTIQQAMADLSQFCTTGSGICDMNESSQVYAEADVCETLSQMCKKRTANISLHVYSNETNMCEGNGPTHFQAYHKTNTGVLAQLSQFSDDGSPQEQQEMNFDSSLYSSTQHLTWNTEAEHERSHSNSYARAEEEEKLQDNLRQLTTWLMQ